MRELYKRATESNTLVLDKHLDSKLQRKALNLLSHKIRTNR